MQLRGGPSEPISKLAFEFLILTAVRTKEVRGARRSEIDFAAKTWTIPIADASPIWAGVGCADCTGAISTTARANIDGSLAGDATAIKASARKVLIHPNSCDGVRS